MSLRILSILLLATFWMFIAPREALAVIQNLNSATGMSQTFQSDSNVTISTNPLTNIHSLGWFGQLPVSRGGTGAGSFINGSIPFIFNGIFSQDNSNFFWDDTNNRLILGSESSPGHITTPSVVTPDTHGVDLEISASAGLGAADGGGVFLQAGDGGLTSGFGGPISLTAGSGNAQLGDSAGGDVFLTGGSSFGNDLPGTINIFAGTALGTATGGDIQMEAGNSNSGAGGMFFLKAGSAQGGNSNGGDFLFIAGKKSGSGRNGLFLFEDGATHNQAVLDTRSLLGSRTFTFPDFSGTFGLLEAGQTWSGLNKFEASTNSTIYVGSSVKSGCIALGDSDGSGITYVTANDGVLTASSTKPNICQ